MKKNKKRHDRKAVSWINYKNTIVLRDILFKSGDIVLERLYAFGSDFAGGAGHFALKSFFHRNVSCCAKLVDLHAQVSCCGVGLLPEIAEFGAFNFGKNRHHSQPQFGVEKWV